MDHENDVEVQAQPAGPCIMVIFGATGDLTRRLLVPALYNLAAAGLLPQRFAVLGVSGSELTDDAFRERLDEGVRRFATSRDAATDETRVDPEIWKRIASHAYYESIGFEDPADYRRLAARLEAIDAKEGTEGNCLFYLATPDRFFATIVRNLAAVGVTGEEKGWRRVVIEKPFGHDLASARALNHALLEVLQERQIYRIDHYLGKETVQNIIALRFANGLFEPIWRREHIDHVQITVAETVGVERRGRFYDATGVLRDMVPNHVFQLLSMIAMEPPNSFEADAVRTEKAKALDAIPHLSEEDVRRNVVWGQYVEGRIGDRVMPAYRSEPDVAPDSRTPTYVAMKLMVDTWRWGSVPFYLRTGKALAKRRTEIAIRFKPAPLALFRDTPVEKLPPNWLVLRIQPDEGVALHFGGKIPGPSVRLGRVKMDFHYKDYFASAPSTGYETLIYDCMMGDQALFQRADSIEIGWAVVQPLLEAWESGRVGPPEPYPAGSDGPEGAEALLARDHRVWRDIA